MTSRPTLPAKLLNLRDSEPVEIAGDGARLCFGQPLLAATEGAGAFDIRVVRLKPGGASADHAHDWEQANFVIAGAGTVTLAGEVRPVGPDDFVYVPPRVRHVFHNTGSDDLLLLSTLGPRE